MARVGITALELFEKYAEGGKACFEHDGMKIKLLECHPPIIAPYTTYMFEALNYKGEHRWGSCGPRSCEVMMIGSVNTNMPEITVVFDDLDYNKDRAKIGKCECGREKHNFIDHMKFCPEYKDL